jgi:epoxyqueuosine reductase
LKILLHICCAPCSIYPIEKLRKDKHAIEGFFYNPNIHPYSEYLKRKDAVEKHSGSVELNVTYSDYDLGDYFQHVVYNEDAVNRCPVCWWIRMKKCAKKAKEGGFDAFTTTLLGSPYQDHEILKSICDDVAKSAQIKFYYDDFRIGFRKAQDEAKSKGIYMQNYCGCLFSEKEKIEKKTEPRRR